MNVYLCSVGWSTMCSPTDQERTDMGWDVGFRGVTDSPGPATGLCEWGHSDLYE